MENIEAKEIKQEALALLKGKWMTGVWINFVFILITIGIEILNKMEEVVIFQFGNSTIILAILTVIFVILNITFTTINTMGNFNCFFNLVKWKKLNASGYSYGFKYMETAFRIGGAFSLFTFLWSLLFFIPGIIKSISYSMAFFIGIEYPDLRGREALELSAKLTQGYKWKVFGLWVHFIGWIILCIITLGIGWLWVGSYLSTSLSILYLKLKSNKPELFIELDGNYYEE